MKKLSDFELAALGGGIAIVTDIFWLINDIAQHSRWDHVLTLIGLTVGTILTAYALRVHKKTGRKPVQSHDDIDYRIALFLARKKFSDHCSKERKLQKMAIKQQNIWLRG